MDIAMGMGKCRHSPISREEAPERITRPGILVFSHTTELLHVNRRALELTDHIDPAGTGPVTVALPAPVTELRAKIQETLDARAGLGIWDTFEVKSVLCEIGRKVLLRGFGLPDPNSRRRSRIVILLQEDLGVRQETMSEQAEQQPRPANSHKAVA